MANQQQTYWCKHSLIDEPPEVYDVMCYEWHIDQQKRCEKLLPFSATSLHLVHNHDLAFPASPVAVVPDLVEVLHPMINYSCNYRLTVFTLGAIILPRGSATSRKINLLGSMGRLRLLSTHCQYRSNIHRSRVA